MKKPIVSKKEQLFDIVPGEQKLRALFFRYPYLEFTLSEIAKETKISKSTASRILARFKEAGLITIVTLGKSGHLWRIRANYENPDFRNRKIVSNLAIIYESNIIAYLNEVFGHPKVIILFGSFRKGEDTTGSDIDIAIEIAEDKELQILTIKELEAFETEVERKVKVYAFNRSHVDLNLFNNIANGIVLSGFLEVNP